jgi:hypothetical protein
VISDGMVFITSLKNNGQSVYNDIHLNFKDYAPWHVPSPLKYTDEYSFSYIMMISIFE